MSDFLQFLNEQLVAYDSVRDILDDMRDDIGDSIGEYYSEKEDIQQTYLVVFSFLERALEYRNIEKGKHYFESELRKTLLLPEQEELLIALMRQLNYAQRQATRIEPNYYV